jgi:pimeloyl-ACP methyl ester carboxylesterase
MPQVRVNGLTINYDVQGEGEPLLLIPYTSADHACYAFQLPAYTEHFSCIAVDLPGSGESDKPAGPYSTDGYADQIAAFLGAIGIEGAHVAGMSLGAAVGIHLAARHPGRVRSLALHSGWHATDDYLKIVVEQWRTLASARPTIADVVIQAIFPWCFTPQMYVDRPEFVGTLVDFVRGRPVQPVDAFLAQTDAVLGHDATEALREIDVPTQITFGARDLVCGTRFAEPLSAGSRGASSWSSTICRTPGCTRTPRPSTARRSTSCCASAPDTNRAGRPRSRPSARASDEAALCMHSAMDPRPRSRIGVLVRARGAQRVRGCSWTDAGVFAGRHQMPARDETGARSPAPGSLPRRNRRSRRDRPRCPFGVRTPGNPMQSDAIRSGEKPIDARNRDLTYRLPAEGRAFESHQPLSETPANRVGAG